ncbi:hypothetical protein HMPREF1039_0905 [Megasphaera lornae]|uniref:Uncharacterized protein n=1 Tax=Megasphaera lornae TaxID=1000568 RepID=D3LSV1_9FIRM|nr:hypothetical protein HMPREF0889_1473 [Megasphaera genomosp. type_1 str. 28L]EGL39377.1 hypothetical protein HMPREF1039_0905 [Megasphaera lornae]
MKTFCKKNEKKHPYAKRPFRAERRGRRIRATVSGLTAFKEGFVR